MALMGSLPNVNEYNSLLPLHGGAAVNQQYLQQFHQQKQLQESQDDYETKVRKFLEMTRDEDNVEDTVRRFIEESSKHQKDRKESEKESRKKKKKEGKKAKKESKKKKKEKKSKKKGVESLEELENAKLREALKYVP